MQIDERSIGSACAIWDKGTYRFGIELDALCCHTCIMSLHTGNSESTFGAWSTEGCREVEREGNKRVCECSQLVHFGILFVNTIEVTVCKNYYHHSNNF